MILLKAPETMNADFMTDIDLHAKLEKGYSDIEADRVQNAADAFKKFKETRPPKEGASLMKSKQNIAVFYYDGFAEFEIALTLLLLNEQDITLQPWRIGHMKVESVNVS